MANVSEFRLCEDGFGIIRRYHVDLHVIEFRAAPFGLVAKPPEVVAQGMFVELAPGVLVPPEDTRQRCRNVLQVAPDRWVVAAALLGHRVRVIPDFLALVYSQDEVLPQLGG